MLFFPHPLTCSEDGLIAVGGRLTMNRLVLAYRSGIFPWYNDGPILWWFTHPRAVILPDSLHISRSMSRLLQKSPWTVTVNYQFREVMRSCAEMIRPNQAGTWINEDMIDAYTELHEHGYAHSVEVWDEDELIGGMYGVLMGEIFFGESMFSYRSNASKYGFLTLAKWLFDHNCQLIDCQQDTDHMKSLGTELLSKESFWKYMKSNQLVSNMNMSGLKYLKRSKELGH